MYLHLDSERLESFRPQIRKIAENTFCWPWANHLNNRNDQQMMTYDFEQLITWMLEKGPEDQDAAATAMALAKAVAKGYMGEALESIGTYVDECPFNRITSQSTANTLAAYPPSQLPC